MEKLSMLFVEDNEDLCSVVFHIFTNLGYEVDVAHDGETAVKLAEQNRYQVALLDYQLPGMNGLELYQQIQWKQPDMGCVFLTAYATLDMIEAALEAGVERVLAKPVEMFELIEAIEHLVAKPV